MKLTNFLDQIFSVLAKQHYHFYICIGLIPAYFFVFYVQHQTKLSFLEQWGVEVLLISILICLAYAFFIASFYGKASKYMRVTRYGFIVRDSYFSEKIITTINPIKKILGYLYVIFRVAHSMLHGFAAGVAFFMWILVKG